MLTLRENERIIKTVRQHRSVVAGAIAWSVLLAGLVFWAFLKFKLNVFGYSWEIITGAVLIAAIVILYKIYIWRKNTLTITSQRVMLDVRHRALSRTVTELLYRDIYDISFKQNGFSAMLNRYGQLVIKTPSGNEITYDKVPSPAGVVEAINKIRAGLNQQPQNESR